MGTIELRQVQATYRPTLALKAWVGEKIFMGPSNT